jgi:hypothetical protein
LPLSPDLWAAWWRRRHARGDVIIVRFADNITIGFEHEQDAQRFLIALRERFAKLGLELHPDKTRLIEFGRRAPGTGRHGVWASRRRSTSSASRICEHTAPRPSSPILTFAFLMPPFRHEEGKCEGSLS